MLPLLILTQRKRATSAESRSLGAAPAEGLVCSEDS